MKYSLRSLMILVTLVCVGEAFTVRAVSLLRQTKDHEELAWQLNMISGNSVLGPRAAAKHRETAKALRGAVRQPWTVIPQETKT